MVVYPTREWLGMETECYITDEGAFVKVEEMSEAEFRKFLLWRLGLANPVRFNKAVREAVLESKRPRARRR
jgi:hypothetical protein